MSNDAQKLAIGFVIHRPENSFYERLALINKAGIPFYIYDNSPEIADAKVSIEPLSHAQYLSSGRNVGLGIGLSDLCQSAYQQDFDGLLFFDQDTRFNLQTISFINNFFNEKIVELSGKYSAINFGGQVNAQKSQNDKLFNDVDFTINSGSLFILETLKKLGWHNRTYFVDGVDYEFCLRSHIAGFKIGKYLNTPYFDHESEQPDQVRVLFGKKLLIRKYSYARIKDAIHSYLKLILQAIKNGEWIFTIKIIRSFLIYAAGQTLSRVPWKK